MFYHLQETTKANHIPPPQNNTEKKICESDRKHLLDIYKTIDEMIARLRNSPHGNATKVAQLTEKITVLQSTCDKLAPNIPAHEQFHFAELVSCLESQKARFTSFSSKCSGDVKLLTEITGTVRDLINVVQRWKFYICSRVLIIWVCSRGMIVRVWLGPRRQCFYLASSSMGFKMVCWMVAVFIF